VAAVGVGVGLRASVRHGLTGWIEASDCDLHSGMGAAAGSKRRVASFRPTWVDWRRSSIATRGWIRCVSWGKPPASTKGVPGRGLDRGGAGGSARGCEHQRPPSRQRCRAPCGHGAATRIPITDFDQGMRGTAVPQRFRRIVRRKSAVRTFPVSERSIFRFSGRPKSRPFPDDPAIGARAGIHEYDRSRPPWATGPTMITVFATVPEGTRATFFAVRIRKHRMNR
jgi:hypothetical protein